MPDREAADHRFAGQFCIVVENLICRKLPVFGTWAVEVAECDSRNSLEKAFIVYTVMKNDDDRVV